MHSVHHPAANAIPPTPIDTASSCSCGDGVAESRGHHPFGALVAAKNEDGSPPKIPSARIGVLGSEMSPVPVAGGDANDVEPDTFTSAVPKACPGIRFETDPVGNAGPDLFEDAVAGAPQALDSNDDEKVGAAAPHQADHSVVHVEGVPAFDTAVDGADISTKPTDSLPVIPPSRAIDAPKDVQGADGARILDGISRPTSELKSTMPESRTVNELDKRPTGVDAGAVARSAPAVSRPTVLTFADGNVSVSSTHRPFAGLAVPSLQEPMRSESKVESGGVEKAPKLKEMPDLGVNMSRVEPARDPIRGAAASLAQSQSLDPPLSEPQSTGEMAKSETPKPTVAGGDAVDANLRHTSHNAPRREDGRTTPPPRAPAETPRSRPDAVGTQTEVSGPAKTSSGPAVSSQVIGSGTKAMLPAARGADATAAVTIESGNTDSPARTLAAALAPQPAPERASVIPRTKTQGEANPDVEGPRSTGPRMAPASTSVPLDFAESGTPAPTSLAAPLPQADPELIGVLHQMHPAPSGREGAPVASDARPEAQGNAVHALKAAAAQIMDITRHATEGSIEVRLHPEELGRLSISFSTRDAGLSVMILADRPETVDLVRRNIDALIQDLRDQGFQDLSADVGSFQGRTPRNNGNERATRPSDAGEAERATTQDTAEHRAPPSAAGIDLRL